MRRSPLFLLLACLAGCNGSNQTSGDFALTILHTNDRHSHFLGIPAAEYDPSTTGDGTVGGIARLATLIEQERQANPETLLFSAGDFSMGTLFTGAQDAAADLNIMSDLGYTAAALGNHEFDWKPEGLVRMIEAAGEPRVPLLCANMEFSDSSPEDDDLEALFGPAGEPGKAIHPYLVHETEGGIRVGLFGLVGPTAAGVSNAAPVSFSGDVDEMAEVAQAVVNQLRQEEAVDVVLALAHVGIIMDGSIPTFETIELARKVEGIDIILSGHKHTVVDAALEVPCQLEGSDWTTLTMEAGSYGRYLGRYQLKRQDGEVSASGQLIPVDDSVAASPEVNQKVEELTTSVADYLETNYPTLPETGAFLDGDPFQVLARSRFDLPRNKNDTSNLACLLSDAMREATGTDFSAVSNGGDLRGSLNRVNGDAFVLADTFVVTPLGTGPDGLLGYPLVKAHLLLSELKIGLEGATCDKGLRDNDYMFTTSGLRLVYDSSRSQYDRIVKMIQYENLDETDPGTLLYDVDNGGFQVDEFTTLVSICLSSYIASMFSKVGLLPRRADGSQVQGAVDELVVTDSDNREIKLWYVFARKLASFGDDVPDQYNPDESQNPLGPYWRRVWDLARHPE